MAESQNPLHSGYRGSEGGIIGAGQRLKDRKLKKLEAEADSKARPRRRPGKNDDGTSDGTLGHKEVAKQLAQYNDGVEPSSREVIEVLLQCPTNGYGRVEEEDFDKVVTAWLSWKQDQAIKAQQVAELKQARDAEATPPKILRLTRGEGGCCKVS